MKPRFDQYDTSPEDRPPQRRPHIGVYFECCGVYVRVYRDPRATHYEGRCPGCLRMVRVRVGPGGTSTRIFRAS